MIIKTVRKDLKVVSNNFFKMNLLYIEFSSCRLQYKPKFHYTISSSSLSIDSATWNV